MKRKTLLVTLLTVIFCLSIVFASNAVQPTAKDMVIAKIKNAEINIDPGFYEKARGEMNIEVTKFDGEVKDKFGDLTNRSVNLLHKTDVDNKVMKMQLATGIKDSQGESAIYFTDDKIIITKDILYLLKDLGLNEQGFIEFIEQCPQYLYMANNELNDMWEMFDIYQRQQIPTEYKDLLLFIVEAVPEKCFTRSSDKIIVNIDQQGFEETIFNLLNKAKNEKERFADLIMGLTQYSTLPEGISQEDLKEQIITGLENFTVPTKEEISAISSFVTVNLNYEAPILPGGTSSYTFKLKINAPGAVGNLTFAGNHTAEGKNMDGTYDLNADFNFDEFYFNLSVNCDYQYDGPTAKSNSIINIQGKQSNSQLFDIGLKTTGINQVDYNLTVEKPVLTVDNSLDVTEYLIQPAPGRVSLGVQASPPDESLSLIVNNQLVATDVPPVIKNGRTYVPVRNIAEALDCQVDWQKPNAVKISAGEQVITMYIGNSNYNVNGSAKQMDAAPYQIDGRTMVPVRFIAQELGGKVEMIGNFIIITK